MTRVRSWKKAKSMKQRSAKNKAQRKARRRKLENKKYIESGLSWYRFVQKNKEKRRDQRLERAKEEYRKEVVEIDDEDLKVQKAVLVSLQAKALEDPTTRVSWKKGDDRS